MGMYRINRLPGGSHLVHRTTWDEEAGAALGAAAGWAVGSGIDLAGAAVRKSRDRRMIKAAQAMVAASEAEDSDHFLVVAADFARRYPREEFGHANLAHALFRKERYGEALTEVDRAVELRLDEWEGRKMRAELYEESGKTSAAIQEYAHLIRNPSYRRLGLLGRASCLADLGDFDQALQDANDAVSALPNEESYGTRGGIYFLMEDFEKCIVDFGRAIQLCPESPDLLEMRAVAYEKLGRDGDAQKDRAAAAVLGAQVGSAQHPDGPSVAPTIASPADAPLAPATAGARNHSAALPATPAASLIPVLIGALLFVIGLTESGSLAVFGLFSVFGGAIWYLILSNSKKKE